MQEAPRVVQRLVVFLVASLSLASLLSGCATRTVRSPIIDRTGIQVDLVREVEGFTTVARGYEHPTIISAPRLVHILNAIEIEIREKGVGTFRQPAFHPEIVERTAQAVSEALAEADPDQQVGVQAVRKEMQLGIFHQKFLTSFLAFVDHGQLYIHLSRVEWPIPQKEEGEPLPEPRSDERPMDFRVVGGEHLFYAGLQTLEIDWKDPVFLTDYRLPGSTDGLRRRREVIEQSPIPKNELDQNSTDEDGVGIDELSAEQLRALADLEDDRNQGRITEPAYQRAKRQLLRER